KKNIRDLIIEGENRLKQNGNAMAKEESILLLSYLLGRQKCELYLNADRLVEEDIVEKFDQWIGQRIKNTPIQYLTGFQNFMGLEFMVRREVFIPRPETEILVEKVIEIIESSKDKDCFSILDIGVGSGVIPVSILSHFKHGKKKITFYAVDISGQAIDLARENARRFHCEEDIVFIEGDLFKPLKNCDESNLFDGIISNPPYLCEEEMLSLAPEICLYEPHEALDGGIQGLDYYRRIVNESDKYLNDHGFLALEIGCQQKDAICSLIYSHAGYSEKIDAYRDYHQNDRVVIAYRNIGNQRKSV
ncbi:MAG: peptide chain release factor N(5)-glutamine methyltransferase, partial [Candidatus Aminicenantes bacterium]|nr:peptide chain release factor N(5)-glutamine methyltransferase [Candidatus Aminicenantes bacterium]